jgi:arsenate reductase-like glutaredoxin family protein
MPIEHRQVKNINLNNMLSKFLTDSNWKTVITFLIALLFVQHCSTCNKIKDLKKQNAALAVKIDSARNPLSERETKDIIEKVMFDFLIYEDDLDKGKTNLTDVKSKIEK